MTTPPNDSYGSTGYGEGESAGGLSPDYSPGFDAPDEAPGYSAGTTDYSAGDDSSSKTETAKSEAMNVKDTTTQATQQVADTAKQQVGQVAGDVKEQASQLASQTKSQLSDQASSQRDRAADGLRSLSEELRTMAESSEQSGIGAQLARQGADLTQQAADFIAQREPSELLDEARDFARRRPGGFLVGSAVAGMVVGRLSRGAMSARSDDSSQSQQFDALRTPTSGDMSGDYDIYASQPTSTMPPTAAGWSPAAAQPAPLLNEPYGEQQPPAGYDPGYGGRA